MAFIVEDGTGLITANSMATVDEFDSYCTDRGIDISGFTTTTSKEVALVKGADYLKVVYYGNWSGTLLLSTQSMPFPRVVDTVTIFPDAVKYANIELAIRSNTEVLLQDLGQRVIEEQVASIKVKYSEYFSEQQSYTKVYSLLKPFLDIINSFSIPVKRV